MKILSVSARKSLVFLFSTTLFFTQLTVHASIISIKDYIDQVESKSPGYDSSKKNVDGAVDTAIEGEFPTSPTFFMQYNDLTDKKLPVNPLAGGTLTLNDAFTTGVQEQFGFGLNAKLSYNLVNNQTNGLPASFFQNGQLIYTNVITELDLSQSLWRNFLGKETKATADIAQASALTTFYAEKFKIKQLIAQAESTYYRLAVAREAVKLANDVLDRAKKILDWTSKRVTVHLMDKADVLQAKAAYQARQLDLKNQKDEERAARLAFNSLRNSVSETVEDDLAEISENQILNLAPPKRMETPDDVKAAQQNERVTVASNELSIQKAKPDLSVFGTIAMNGLSSSFAPADSQAFSLDHPTYMIGLKLTMPLFFWESEQARRGRLKQQFAAESSTRQKRLESDQNWEDLNQHLAEAKERLSLASELVTAQKEKLDYEKYRISIGRTTTYQVLLFEQDYAEALLGRLKIENEILNVHAQLKTYAE